VNKKLLIIGAAGAVLLLGGGGAGAYLLLAKDKPAEEQVEKKPEPPQIDTTPRKFVTVDNLSAPMPSSSGNRNDWVFFEVSLEVRTDDEKKSLVVMLPRLRDAFLREIYAKSVLKNDGSEQIDLDGVRTRFRKAANQAVGGDIVQDVLITKSMRSRV
jgi:flagellar protein FliL